MGSTIAIVSAKGGTGKTTTALNLAVALAEKGRRVLLVDLDPQGAVGLSLARDDGEWSGLAEVLMEVVPVERAVVETKLAGFSILPRGRLNPVDICEYERMLYSSGTLGGVLSPLAARFDYVIIDTPSGLGMVTRAALGIVEFAIAPLQAEPLAMRAFDQLLRVVDHVQATENEPLRLLGILPTMVQLGLEQSLGVMTVAWTDLAGVFESFIPRADVFARASETGLPLCFLSGKLPPEAKRFEMLAEEVETRIAELRGAAGESDDRPQRELI